MPRASQVSRIVCPDCGKTLAINGKVKCRNCGTEVPGFSNIDIVVSLVEKLGVDKSLLKARLFGEENWIDQLLAREDEAHQTFGTSYNRDLFVATAKEYGRERIEEWEHKYLLRFSALPQAAMTQDANFDGWKIKPYDWYYNQVEAGKILLRSDSQLRVDKNAFELRGEITLIDTRLKPACRDGKQMFANDKLFLGQIISRLRKAGKIAGYKHGPQSSRFGISANEWRAIIKPEVAKLLGVKVSRVRLERGIEANIIPQLYLDLSRAKDGETNTWIWYEEYYKGESERLDGGSSDCGGLMFVRRHYSNNHWRDRALRPLVVLGS